MYSPALTDFIVMADGTSNMFITGPDVIRAVTGEDVGFEELGGAPDPQQPLRRRALPRARTRTTRSTTCGRCWATCPANNLSDPPVWPEDGERPEALEVTEADLELDTLVPDSDNQPYDMRTVVEHVLDHGELLEVQPLYAQNVLIGFGHVEGQPVGDRREPAAAHGRHAGHQRRGEGRAVRADVRRVQPPGADVRRRARASCRAPTRSGTASSGAARSSSTPTPRRPSRSSPSSPARPTAARTSSWAPSSSAPTSTSPGRRRRSPSWARAGR